MNPFVRRQWSRHRALILIASATAVVSMVGCVHVMPPPMASEDNVRVLKAANLTPVTAGTFKLAAGRPAEMDRQLAGGLRGGNIEAPEGSYSQHLRDVLMAELRSAGILDVKSTSVIEAQLTDSKVDAAIGTGTARLAARFQVLRDGKSTFDKEVAVEDAWDSSFIGAVAIPRAIEHYQALYRTLVGKLVADAEFQRALAR